MILVFDLDDTVTETDKYSEYYISKFFKENNLPYKKVCSTVRYAEKKFNWSKDEALKWYKTYGDEMMLNFPLKEFAKEAINELYDLGHTIVIATARSDDWHSDPKGVTLKWLENNDIRYHKLFVGRSDKEEICKEVNADVFLDDDVTITSRVAEYFKSINKGTSCLMSSDYNINEEVGENIIRVKDFKSFFQMVCKEGIVEK